MARTNKSNVTSTDGVNQNPTIDAAEALKQTDVTDLEKGLDEVPEEPTITWKKIGGGSLRLGNRMIKQNEVFVAKESEIPQAFRDVVIPQQIIPGKQEVKYVPVTYTLIPVDAPEDAEDGAKYFNILDSYGKTINEKPLEESKAKSFIVSLNS